MSDKWNPAHFGETTYQVESGGQMTIFYDLSDEPPEPDDFLSTEDFEKAWEKWEAEKRHSPSKQFWRCRHGLHPTIATVDINDDRFICCSALATEEQIELCEERINQQQWRISDLMTNCKDEKLRDRAIASSEEAILEEVRRIHDLLANNEPVSWIEVGAVVNCTHPLTSGHFEVVAYPHVDNQGESWSWAVIKNAHGLDQLMAVKYLSPLENMQAKVLPPNSPLKKDFSGQTGEFVKTMHIVYLPDENKKIQFDNDEVMLISEQVTVNDSKEHEMKFHFSHTQAIIDQIANLQEQLNRLTASLKPYQECEEKAEELRLFVSQHGDEMRQKGIQEKDIVKWAETLYNAATGEQLNFLGDTATIAAQNEQLYDLRNQLAATQRQRDEALAKITDMTAASLHVAENLKALQDERKQLESLSAQADIAAVELLQKENASLVAKIQELESLTDDMAAQIGEFYQDSDEELEQSLGMVVGDIVQHKDGLVGTVVYTPGLGAKVISVKTPSGVFNYPVESLQLISRSSLASNQGAEDIQAQNKGRNFIEGITSKAKANNITWQDIIDVCQGSNECFREILLSATTKPQKGLIEKLPQLASDYINKTGNTDLDWTGETFKSKVEVSLEAKKSLQCHSSDIEIAAQMNDRQQVWAMQMRSLLHHNVPRFIKHIADRGGISEQELRWLQCEDQNPDYPMEVITRADEYLLFPKNEKTFEKGLFVLVKSLAIMSFIPGGIRFLGVHFSSQIERFAQNESET